MLQAALKEGEADRFSYYVFDLLHLDNRDLRELPLIERKAELARLIASAQMSDGAIRLSEHFEADGALVLQEACRMKLEGIVSKRADAPYRPGRVDTFIKIKCADLQEFVVGGFSPSTVLPRAIGALVAGYYEDGRLVYAGRIGTGYTRAVARDLWKRLNLLETDTARFDQIPNVERRRREVHWVEPSIVIEAHFRGWTAERLLRQASFKGVREDKPAHEVVREVAAVSKNRSGTLPAKSSPAKSLAAKSPPSRTSPGKISAKSPVIGAKTSTMRSRKTASRTSQERPKAANENEIRFTHPDRVYWVDVGITKQDLADYYRATWDWMAPQVANRPLALVRCPDGTKGECFFQKHASAGLYPSKHLRSVIDNNRRQVLAVEDLDGLLSLVQAGVLEVHVRGSMIDRLDLCDRIVFDIDPSDEVG